MLSISGLLLTEGNKTENYKRPKVSIKKLEQRSQKETEHLIQSEDDYKFYLEADRIALHMKGKKPLMFQDEIWRFQRLLRKIEFIQNCSRSRLKKINELANRYRFHLASVNLGFTIEPNVFGPGLSIAHRGPIVVSKSARVGENCRINHCVTIGTAVYDPTAISHDLVPKIGNNVFIGPGAIIVGDIEIADGIAIGANSYVNKSFKEPNISIAGCPAKKISNKGSRYCWDRATEILRAGKNQKSNSPYF
jgi:serine O-acetyltransferase